MTDAQPPLPQPNPTRGSGFWWPGALATLTLIRLLIAAYTPLSPDEAYYWVWSKALAPGYLDHPPMVALWIKAGTTLAGDGALGVRLLAPLAASLGSLLVAQAANDLLPGRRTGHLAALMLNATLLFGVGAVTMTPDTPLLFFWTGTIWALARLQATARGGWWLVAGIAAGLACDSKYTGVLLLPAVLLWLVWVPGPWRRRAHPWAAGALALACTAPVIAWNAAHDWAGFLKQGGRVGDWNPSRSVQFVAELLAGQLGLATPLLAVLFCAGVALAARHAWRRNAGAALLALLALLPAAVFVQHALGDRVQANWPAILYPTAAIAAAGLAGRWLRWRTPGIGLGFLLTVFVYAQAALAILPLPGKFDPALRQLGGWPAFALAVAQAAHASGARFVAVENYGDAAELARTLPREIPVVGIDARWAFVALPNATAMVDGHPGLLIRAARYAGAPDGSDWATVGPPSPLARARDGLVAEEYRLYPVIGRAGTTPVVALPR